MRMDEWLIGDVLGTRQLDLHPPARRQVLPHPQRLHHRRLRYRLSMEAWQPHRYGWRAYRLALPPHQARLETDI